MPFKHQKYKKITRKS